MYVVSLIVWLCYHCRRGMTWMYPAFYPMTIYSVYFDQIQMTWLLDSKPHIQWAICYLINFVIRLRCPFLLQHNSREPDQSQWGRATETVSRETAGNWPHAAGAWGKDSAPAGGWSAAVILTLGDTQCRIFPNINCFGACFFQEAQLARSEAERMASLAGSQSHASLLSLDAAMEEIPEDERPPNILSPSNNKDR